MPHAPTIRFASPAPSFSRASCGRSGGRRRLRPAADDKVYGMPKIVRFALFLAVVSLACPCAAQAPANDRLRVVIETDAGGDPDDEQSLVRFLLYTNEW